MTQGATRSDERLGALLRAAAPAPAPRDALFRIQVMEARERRRFQRRRALLTAAGAVAGCVALSGLFGGGELRTAASGTLIAFAVVMAGMIAILTRRVRMPI